MKSQPADALIRSFAAICVGVLGYWLPLYGANYYVRLANGADLDDRLGLYFLWTLPITIVYSVLATISLVRAYRGQTPSNKGCRLALILGIAMLCWSPLIKIGAGIALNK
jgi:hypothetical protein